MVIDLEVGLMGRGGDCTLLHYCSGLEKNREFGFCGKMRGDFIIGARELFDELCVG